MIKPIDDLLKLRGSEPDYLKEDIRILLAGFHQHEAMIQLLNDILMEMRKMNCVKTEVKNDSKPSKNKKQSGV